MESPGGLKILLLLFASLVIDGIGMGSYIFPALGEASDIIWAPISAWMIFKLYNRTDLALVGFAEEMLPGLDFIPTATIAWCMLMAQIVRGGAGVDREGSGVGSRAWQRRENATANRGAGGLRSRGTTGRSGDRDLGNFLHSAFMAGKLGLGWLRECGRKPAFMHLWHLRSCAGTIAFAHLRISQESTTAWANAALGRKETGKVPPSRSLTMTCRTNPPQST